MSEKVMVADPGSSSEAVSGGAPNEGAENAGVINETVTEDEGLPSDGEVVEGEGEGAPVAERPEWLPEKFKTVEEMAAAYKALEQKQGQGNETQQQQEQAQPKIPETPEVNAAADVVKRAGLDFVKLNETYAKDGKLTASDYEALSKQGIPEAMVNSFIAGQIAIQKANAATTAKAAYDAAGGADKYGEMITWAKDNMSREAIVSFNKTLDGNDTAAIDLAVKGLASAYKAAGGSEPKNLATGEKGGQSVYTNVEQMVADMSDPRYETDPAFRKRVEGKVSRSKI